MLVTVQTLFLFLFLFSLRTLLALGCHVAQANVHAEDDLKKIKLPKEYDMFDFNFYLFSIRVTLLTYSVSSCSYMMSNGYKPAPLELTDVKLTAGQEVLVDKLAENAHNVWAKDRIKQGWTYGIQQVKAIHKSNLTSFIYTKINASVFLFFLCNRM